MCNDRFLEETEVLQAIYEDEITILNSDEDSAEIEITIHPNTADDEDGKFVCLTLHFNFSFSSKSEKNYPDKAPHMVIKNPRGLADSHLASIEENLKSLAVSSVGEQMLYTLIEYAKDSLTDNNHPSCDCPICLEKFVGSDVFFRTPCYHYFHKTCMKEYLTLSLENIVCPVCRLQFQVDPGIFDSIIVDHMSTVSDIETFEPNQVYKDWRAKCDVLFQKQKKNGGIIDIEYEKNKYLLTTTHPREVDTGGPLTLAMTNLTTSEEMESERDHPSTSAAKDPMVQCKVRPGERSRHKKYPSSNYGRNRTSGSSCSRTEQKPESQNHKHKIYERKDETGTSNIDSRQKPANKRRPRDRSSNQVAKGDKPTHSKKLSSNCPGGMGEGKHTVSNQKPPPKTEDLPREEKSSCVTKGSLKSVSQPTDFVRPPPGFDKQSSLNKVPRVPPGFTPRHNEPGGE